MAIYYFSSMFEDDHIDSIFSDPLKISYAANKFNRMLSKGFAQNEEKTTVFAALPVTKNNCKKVLISKKRIDSDYYHIHYYFTVNVSYLKNVLRIIQSFFTVLFAPRGTSAIVDIFAQSLCAGVYYATKIRRLPYYCIVTDLPEYVGKIGTELKVGRLMKNIISHSSGYILLTEQMKDRLPCEHKKIVVVEGLVPTKDNIVAGNNNALLGNKKTVMYAGSLHKEFGVDRLIEAFLQCRKEDEELHLFGSGNYVPVIKEITAKNDCVIYHGVCANSEIINYEKAAKLLVNPRSSKGEYTKYSFPSKVIEYFSSGTPVLMAKLPGIPDEYYDYCMTFDDNDANGLRTALRMALDISNDKLATIGTEARKFVVNHKNNMVQAKKVIEAFGISLMNNK